jgi:hypothetical protein
LVASTTSVTAVARRLNRHHRDTTGKPTSPTMAVINIVIRLMFAPVLLHQTWSFTAVIAATVMAPHC